MSRKRRWVKWGLVVGFWVLVGLLFTSQFYFAASAENVEAEGETRVIWARMLVFQLLHWGSWGGFTALVLMLVRRIPLERWDIWLGKHILASLAVAALQLAVSTSFLMMIQPFVEEEGHGFVMIFNLMMGSFFFPNVLIYWAVLGVGYGVDYYRRYREGQVHTSNLEAQLAQAQLQALKMQLHPHFLFNTLNAIASLVRTNQNEAATDMIAGLSDLLRLTLESSAAQEVPLKQELDFLKRYLDIEQIRFEDRLQVRMAVDPETLEARVPNLLLQPLVENAIRHGIAQRASAGLIEIHATRANGCLRLQVRDDGPGLPEGEAVHNGVGLTNTMARLQRLYGDAQRVTFANAEGGGAVVTLELPFVNFDRGEGDV